MDILPSLISPIFSQGLACGNVVYGTMLIYLVTSLSAHETAMPLFVFIYFFFFFFFIQLLDKNITIIFMINNVCVLFILLSLSSFSSSFFYKKKMKTFLDVHWDDFVSDFDVYKSNDKYCYVHIIWIKVDISK